MHLFHWLRSSLLSNHIICHIMKSTKFIIAALLPAALWLGSCDDDSVDSTNLGRTVEFPEMSERERGYSNGEIFGNSLVAINDTIQSARDKGVLETPVFCGMLTPPFSKIQRPYELYTENADDELWMEGFREGIEETADLATDSELHDKIMKILEKVSFSDIDNYDNAMLALQLEELLNK